LCFFLAIAVLLDGNAYLESDHLFGGGPLAPASCEQFQPLMGSAAAITNGVCMAVKPDPPKATQIIAAITIAPIMIVPTVLPRRRYM
jgi:hypothetical protein